MEFLMNKILILFLLCLQTVVAYSQPVTVSMQNKIIAKSYVVFDGKKGWEKDGTVYRLACGPIIVECDNEDILCTWLSGSNKEPATDNCVLVARSSDKGVSWSEPEILVPAGNMAGCVTNMHKAPNGTIVVFAAGWPSDKKYCEWHYFKMESQDNGNTWGPRKPFIIHSNSASITDGPLELANGKYLYTGNFSDARQRPLVGSISDLALAKTEKEALGVPAVEGKGKNKLPDKFKTHKHGCCVFIADNEIAVDFEEYGYIANRPLGFTEANVIRLKDDTIVMLMRAEWGGYLWRSDSKDDGKTWSQAYQTDIPNPSSLIDVLRLPDDRIALIHNPNGGVIGKRSKRNPLSIWISSDEMKSWCIKQDIFNEGKLAYPCARIINNKLVFAFDKNRRKIIFVEIDFAK